MRNAIKNYLSSAVDAFDPGLYQLGPQRLASVDFFAVVDVSAGATSHDLLAASARTSPDLVESFSTANTEATPDLAFIIGEISADIVCTDATLDQQEVMLIRQNLWLKHQSQGASAKRFAPVRLFGQSPSQTSVAAITGPAYAYGQTVRRDSYRRPPGGPIPLLMWTDTLELVIDQTLDTLPADFSVILHCHGVVMTRQHFESNHARSFTSQHCG